MSPHFFSFDFTAICIAMENQNISVGIKNIVFLPEDALKGVFFFLEGHNLLNLFLAFPANFRRRLQASSVTRLCFETGQCDDGPLHYYLRRWPPLISSFQALEELKIDLGNDLQGWRLPLSICDLSKLPKSLTSLEIRFRTKWIGDTVEEGYKDRSKMEIEKSLLFDEPDLISHLNRLKFLSVEGDLFDYFRNTLVLPPSMEKFELKGKNLSLENLRFEWPKSSLTHLSMSIETEPYPTFLESLPDSLLHIEFPSLCFLEKAPPPPKAWSNLKTIRLDSLEIPRSWIEGLSPSLVSLAIASASDFSFSKESDFFILPATLESLTLYATEVEPTLMHLLPQGLTLLHLESESADILSQPPSTLKKIRFPYSTVLTLASFDNIPQCVTELDVSCSAMPGEESFPLLPEGLLSLSCGISISLFNASLLPQKLTSLSLPGNYASNGIDSQAMPLLPRSLTHLSSCVLFDDISSDLTGLPPDLKSLSLRLSSPHLYGSSRNVRLSGVSSLRRLERFEVFSVPRFKTFPVIICKGRRPAVLCDSITIVPGKAENRTEVGEEDPLEALEDEKAEKDGFLLPPGVTCLAMTLSELIPLIPFIPPNILKLSINLSEGFASYELKEKLIDFLPRTSIRSLSMTTILDFDIISALPHSATSVTFNMSQGWAPELKETFPFLSFYSK